MTSRLLHALQHRLILTAMGLGHGRGALLLGLLVLLGLLALLGLP